MDGTGVFLPAAPAPAPDVTYTDGTGVFPPAASGPASAATDVDGTGVFLPAAPAPALDVTYTDATRAFPPDQPSPTDATGVYVPGQIGTPGAEALEGTRVFDPSACDVAAPTGARGKADPTGVARCGRYLLKRFHAKGGMGEIWLADDPEIGRSVALKRMLGRPRPDLQRRFLTEAQVTGQLEHPGIVPIHEVGANEQGQPFYAMKFVRGQTLQKVIDDHHAAKSGRGNRDVEQFRLLHIFLSLCQTVAYAHSKGVLHRDLKPENVMLGSYGETLLLDWGLAKVQGQPDQPAGDEPTYVQLDADSEAGTQAGVIMGSPQYISPEAAGGLTAEVDQRSDVYLLGGILYAILTGLPPRRGKNLLDVSLKAVPVRKIKPQVSPGAGGHLHEGAGLAQAGPLRKRLGAGRRRAAATPPANRCRPIARASRSVPGGWAKRHRRALARSATAVLAVALLLLAGYWMRELVRRRKEEVRAAEQRHETEVRRREEAERKHAEADREAVRLQDMDQARRDVREFRRLADEARFFAATTDPVSENAPYFDPHEGENKVRAAIARTENWGPTVDGLPLPDERDALRKDLYDLLLLLAQARIQNDTEPEAGRETLALLTTAGRLRPPSRSYYRLRARAQQRLGDYEQAVADRQLAEHTATPTTSLDHFLLAEQHRRESARPADGDTTRKGWQPDPVQMEKAIAAYRLALEIEPDHYWSHFQLGRCYLSLGRYAEATEVLGACVALRRDVPWAYSVRGLALAQQNRYAAAEHDLDRAVRLDPEARPARLNRGVVSWAQQKYDDALRDFEAVLQPPTEKRLIQAAYYRGQLHLERGEVGRALEDFNSVVAELPGFRPVHLLRARILIAQGEDARGLEDLDAYLGARPLAGAVWWRPARRWEIHARRGRLLRLLHAELPADQRRKPSGQAARLPWPWWNYARRLDAGGQAAEVYDDLGALLEMTNKPNEAVAAYGKGVDIAPRDVKLLNKRGWAQDAIGQPERALEDFTAATRADPEDAEAHSGLGYIQARKTNVPEAQREADLALLHGGDRSMILHNVACIYVVLAQADERQAPAHQDAAMALLRRAVKVWRRSGTGPNAIDQIKSDPTFEPLRKRRDYQELSGAD